MAEFFATKADDGYGGFVYNLTPAGYGALIAVFILVIIAIGFIKDSKKKNSIETKRIVFSAMAIALAMVTSMLKLFDMPMGGSITLFSMLFITLIGNWYGLRVGLMTSVSYGLLQLIIDPYIISIPQMLIDYIFAFGALGLSGIFSKKRYGLIIGYIVSVFGRFIFSVISGVVFFASYAPESMGPVIYSICYNGAYLGAEALITIIVMLLPPVASALERVKKLVAD